MRNIILTFILFFLCSAISAQIKIDVDSSDFRIPSNEEIFKDYQERFIDSTDKQAFPEVSIFEESILPNLIPMVYVEIIPDEEGGLGARMDNSMISFWHPNGGIWLYQHSEAPGRPDLPLGLYPHSLESPYYLNLLIAANLPQEYIILFYTHHSDKHYFNFIGFTDGESINVYDKDGKKYNSLEEIVLSKYGSLHEHANYHEYSPDSKGGMFLKPNSGTFEKLE